MALADAVDEATFGGKAAQLAVALRRGLPAPPGVAVPAETAARIAAGDASARAALTHALASYGGQRFAVRSSAVGEDSAAASFAGQHRTLLNVARAGVPDAVGDVWRFAAEEPATGYRDRMGLTGDPGGVGVVVQVLVDADVAGVLFTRHPVTGADERVVEASWGLGEAVVAGHVVPDGFRLTRGGVVVEQRAGVKDVRVALDEDGGTVTLPIDADTARLLCLDEAALARLADLADACEEAFGGPRDIEWAFASGQLWLLQARPMTAYPPEVPR